MTILINIGLPDDVIEKILKKYGTIDSFREKVKENALEMLE